MFSTVFLIYVVVVILPVVFWFWFFRKQDRAEPEPKKLLFKVFLGGAIVVVLASILEGVIESVFFPEISAKLAQSTSGGIEDFIGSPAEFFGFLAIYFLAGPVEEFMKFFVMKILVYRKIVFNQVADGVVYGVTIALSFSLIENSIYFMNIWEEMLLTPNFVAIVVVRGVITTMLHVLAAAIMGLYLGRAKFSKENHAKIMLKGVFIAALVHGTYNVSIFFSFGMLSNLLLLTICFQYVMRELRSEQSQMVWRLVVPEKEIAGNNNEVNQEISL